MSQEERRMTAVRNTRLLGTPAEERFDKITRLACRMFRVPISMIDVIGDDVAWMKSAQGTDRLEAPREYSYCHKTSESRDREFLICDARVDPRLYGNPYVQDFVFYAGVSLQFEGQKAGVFCIADSNPRILTDEEIESLHDFAVMAERELQVFALSESQAKLAAAHEELKMKSMIDDLTRVWNREAIFKISEMEIQNPCGLITLDIDHFKSVNDVYGHPGGDIVLRSVGDILRKSVRAVDAIGRIGGEEFLIVVPGCDAEGVLSAAERIRRSIESSPIELNDKLVTITVSIGATVTDGTIPFSSLSSTSDNALYQAKRSGRNRCVVL